MAMAASATTGAADRQAGTEASRSTSLLTRLLKSLDLGLQGETVLPQRFIELIRCRLHSPIELRPPDDDREAPAQMLPPRPPARASESDEVLRLSDKEHLILRHLTQGASNKLIARDLHIAEATVKVHVKAILRKIGVRNRTQAAMWAVKNWALGGQRK
jgi:two-component system nitrate/nitrite response regulator NarL